MAVLLNTVAIMPKSEDKYVEKVFNSTELHFSEVTSFKIGTLIADLILTNVALTLEQSLSEIKQLYLLRCY